MTDIAVEEGRLSQAREEALHSLDRELGVTIRRVRRSIASRATLVHPELNSVGYSLLMSLYENGPARASVLADLFAIDKGAVSRQVSLMEERDLVERAPDPADGRASLITITDLGRTRLDDVARSRFKEWGLRLNDWSDEDLHGLAQLIAAYNVQLGNGTQEAAS